MTSGEINNFGDGFNVVLEKNSKLSNPSASFLVIFCQ